MPVVRLQREAVEVITTWVNGKTKIATGVAPLNLPLKITDVLYHGMSSEDAWQTIVYVEVEE
jgi:hypothetical protein